MRYLALVVDYDGTLTLDGRVSAEVVRALERLRFSGRRAILVTGRRLDELLAICDCVRHFDLLIAENGAVIYDPATREEQRLANPPAKALIQALQRRGVSPLDVGQVLVSTDAANRGAVQDVLWDLGLEAQVIANRGAVMVLPAGINKGTGLDHGLRRLRLSRHEIVGIGDAENDHSFLERCECAVAVGNALPSIKEIADLVMSGVNGRGVVELIDELVAEDLHRMEGAVERNLITLGTRLDGTPVRLPPHGHNVLIAGPSASGKSSLAAGIIERLIEKDYQVFVVDPEGDYGTLRDVVALGNQWRAPSVNEILSVLDDPQVNASVNLLGIELADRPHFLAQLFPSLQAMRTHTGRPHWLVLDEAHHMLPEIWGHAGATLPRQLGEVMLITVHPGHITPAVLEPVDVVIATGVEPETTLRTFAHAAGKELAWTEGLSSGEEAVVAWFTRGGDPPFPMRPARPHAERLRHQRKYAEGDLRWHSFYFRGPDGRHNLKAQNLSVFCQIADGIDEETWTYHLRHGDYSRWLRDAVRDEHLASEVERIERRTDVAPGEARKMVTDIIRARYTLPE